MIRLFVLAAFGAASAVAQPAAHLTVQQGHSASVSAVAVSPDGHTVLTGGWDGAAVLWHRATHRELRRFAVPEGIVWSVAFAPDGGTVATAHFADGTARLWDAATGAEQRVLRHGHSIAALAFSSDGTRLATGGDDSTAGVWDLATGQELRRLSGHGGAVRAVAFTPDGARLLTGSNDGTARVWDLATGREVLRMDHLHDWGPPPDDDSGEAWEETTPTPVQAVAFWPDGSRIVTGTSDGTVWVWDTASGAALERFVLDSDAWLPLPSEITAVAVSADGAQIAAAAGGQGALLLDTEPLRLRHTLTHLTTTDLAASAPVLAVAFSPDASTLVVGCEDRTVSLWDVATGRRLGTLEGETVPLRALALSTDGRFVTGDDQGVARVWELAQGQQVRWFEAWTDWDGEPMRDIEGLRAVAFSPDGRRVATGSWVHAFDLMVGIRYDLGVHNNSSAAVYAARTGDRLAGFLHADAPAEPDTTDPWAPAMWDEEPAFAYPILSVAFAPDGGAVLTGGYDGEARLWPLADDLEERAEAWNRGEYEDDELAGEAAPLPEPLWVLEHGPLNAVHALAYAPDGMRILSGANDGRLRLWDAASGTLMRTLEGHAEAVRGVAWSPDGRRVASAAFDGTARLWDVTTGEVLRVLRHEGGVRSASVTAVAFTPDGRRLLSTSYDGLVRLWDAEDGMLLAELAGHVGSVVGVAVLADGAYALSAGTDGTVRLWNLLAHREVAAMAALRDDAWVVVAPDGRFDTNNLDEVRGLHWMLPERPFEPVPIEAFLRDYYEPRLLSRLLAGENLPPVKSLTISEGGLPTVSISRVERGEDGTATVTIEVESVEPVRDLRVFRDGRLVGWVDGPLPLADGTYRTTLDGLRVQAPLRNGPAEAVGFSAYAFTASGVKAPTGRAVLPLESQSRRAPAPARVYLISFGVNAFADPAWDLSFAVNDARLFQEILSRKLPAAAPDAVVPVALLADHEGPVTATAAALRAVLAALAGEAPAPGALAGIPNAERLQEATPADLVILTFSTHGYAEATGDFYLFPADIDPAGGGAVTPALLETAISSDELAGWLRGVDAGQIVLVIDACQSAAAVEALGFKPGPMGSRGLGQLAYDKKALVLAASQSSAVALESDRLRHGLLTYALVRDGLEQGSADFDRVDGVIEVEEWLRYALDRVPSLEAEVAAGGTRGVEVVGDLKADPLQRPSLFDFSRRPSRVVVAYPER